MNKPSKDSEATVFLVILGVIGIALPAALCGGGLLLFGFMATPAPIAPMATIGTTFAVPAQASQTTLGGSFDAATPTTLGGPPAVDFPSTLPPTSIR